MPDAPVRLAYLLKGWPRISELFIASEIHRLEQLGVPLRIFVLRERDEQRVHATVARIRARVEYLPQLESAKSGPLLRWLWRNLPPVLPALLRVALRRPQQTGAAALDAMRHARRVLRSGERTRVRVYLKEFLQAAALADRVLADPALRHLHAHFCHGATTVTRWAAQMTGHTFSFTAHAKDIYQGELNPGGLLARKLRSAEFAVTCTDANRKELLRAAPGARVHTVLHGLNSEFEALLATSPQRGPRAQRPELRIIGVGRLVEKKGFDLLIEACALLRERSVPVRLELVGEDGDHATCLRERIRTLRLEDCVLLRGALLQRELLTALEASDVFCLPCRVLADGDRDGIPNVLVEAMACGLPVVTTAVSGIPELVVDSLDGLVVPPESPHALASALLRMRDEPAFAQRLGEEARRTVRDRFDGAKTTSELAALFAPLLDGSALLHGSRRW